MLVLWREGCESAVGMKVGKSMTIKFFGVSWIVVFEAGYRTGVALQVVLLE